MSISTHGCPWNGESKSANVAILDIYRQPELVKSLLLELEVLQADVSSKEWDRKILAGQALDVALEVLVDDWPKYALKPAKSPKISIDVRGIPPIAAPDIHGRGRRRSRSSLCRGFVSDTAVHVKLEMRKSRRSVEGGACSHGDSTMTKVTRNSFAIAILHNECTAFHLMPVIELQRLLCRDLQTVPHLESARNRLRYSYLISRETALHYGLSYEQPCMIASGKTSDKRYPKGRQYTRVIALADRRTIR